MLKCIFFKKLLKWFYFSWESYIRWETAPATNLIGIFKFTASVPLVWLPQIRISICIPTEMNNCPNICPWTFIPKDIWVNLFDFFTQIKLYWRYLSFILPSLKYYPWYSSGRFLYSCIRCLTADLMYWPKKNQRDKEIYAREHKYTLFIIWSACLIVAHSLKIVFFIWTYATKLNDILCYVIIC